MTKKLRVDRADVDSARVADRRPRAVRDGTRPERNSERLPAIRPAAPGVFRDHRG